MNFTSLVQVNKTDDFYVCLVPDAHRARKAKFVKIINETQFGKTESTEFLIEIFKKGKPSGTNLLYAHEIGIGYTKKEAKKYMVSSSIATILMLFLRMFLYKQLFFHPLLLNLTPFNRFFITFQYLISI